MSSDFKKFWVGQTISNLGSSFTQWAVPLLVYQLTHSAVSLGIATAATFLPYLLFGLIIGAWMDRVDRKRAMIALDWLNALVILSIPLVAQFGHLNVWWIYGVTFIQSTIAIAFSAGEFAAIPSLVSTDDLVTANGRIQATYSAAQVVGPLLAGALISFLPLTWVLAFDAGSFALSAVSLSLVRASFNVQERRAERGDDDPPRRPRRAPLRVLAPCPTEHLADDGPHQLRRRDDVCRTRALRRSAARRARRQGRRALRRRARPVWSSPACLQDACANGSASPPSR